MKIKYVQIGHCGYKWLNVAVNMKNNLLILFRKIITIVYKILREFKPRNATLHVFVILLNIGSNRAVYIHDGIFHA